MLKTFFAVLAVLAVVCNISFAQENIKPVTDSSSKVARMRTGYMPETIQKAQQTLKAKGLYKGEAHGKLDAATKDAVKAFQQQESLKPTGLLNKDTRVRLGIESAADAGSVKSKKNAKPAERAPAGTQGK